MDSRTLTAYPRWVSNSADTERGDARSVMNEVLGRPVRDGPWNFVLQDGVSEERQYCRSWLAMLMIR